jgi:hypothetical protein
MTRLTVDLPDDLAHSVALLAASRGWNAPQMAAELIRASLHQRDAETEPEGTCGLSDEEVVAMADLQLKPDEAARLQQLLDLNGEGGLTAEGQRELDELMQTYDDALLRKSCGLAEAVRRGLRQPIAP